MRTYRAQKAALTRALNSKEPDKILTEVARFYAEYRDEDKPLPDDWYRWNIAQQDALYAIQRHGSMHHYQRNVESGAREVWTGYRWMNVEG